VVAAKHGIEAECAGRPAVQPIKKMIARDIYSTDDIGMPLYVGSGASGVGSARKIHQHGT